MPHASCEIPHATPSHAVATIGDPRDRAARTRRALGAHVAGTRQAFDAQSVRNRRARGTHPARARSALCRHVCNVIRYKFSKAPGGSIAESVGIATTGFQRRNACFCATAHKPASRLPLLSCGSADGVCNVIRYNPDWVEIGGCERARAGGRERVVASGRADGRRGLRGPGVAAWLAGGGRPTGVRFGVAAKIFTPTSRGGVG